MNRLTKSRIALYLAFIFLAGAVSGGLLMRTSGWGRPPHRGPPSVGKMCDHVKKRFQERLALTPEQVQRIDPIINRMGEELRAIHRTSTEQVESVIQRSNAEIVKELTPEQRIEFDKMERERQAWIQKKRPKEGRGPKPGG